MISAEHIVKKYNGIKALEDISFTVDQGEIFGFIGPDGAGKTSLFRILTSLILPDQGTATVNNLDVIKDFRKLRAIVGYMPGQFSLYSDLTVEENLNFFATVFGTTIQANYHLIRDIYAQIGNESMSFDAFKLAFKGWTELKDSISLVEKIISVVDDVPPQNRTILK